VAFKLIESAQTRDTGGAGAGALGDSLAKPELARKFHDNAVRSLPEERAAEIAARTLALPDAPPTLSEADFKAWTAAPQEAAASGGEQ
jgi:hypothetical protein